MIKNIKLPDNILEKIPDLISVLKKNRDIVAFYLFGSGASGNLKPLSDIDFAVIFKKN